MSKPRSAMADFSVYLVIRVIVCVLQAVSFEIACKLAAFMAWLAYRVDRRHREVALENLRLSFPGRYSEAGLHDMVRAVYRHFCRLIAEIVYIPRRVHVTNWLKYIDYPRPEDPPRMYGALLSGRPMILVTGHFGNWEMGGYLFGLLGYRIHSIARPIDNPYLDRYLRTFREKTRQRILTKKGDFDSIDSVLAAGGLLGMVGDQDAGPRGCFANFLGRPASTHKALALLALEHEALIVVVGAARAADPMFYHALVEDVIDARDYQAGPDAVAAITQRYTSALERLVRLYPDQYFWLHRRWKHQPTRGKKKAA